MAMQSNRVREADFSMCITCDLMGPVDLDQISRLKEQLLSTGARDEAGALL